MQLQSCSVSYQPRRQFVQQDAVLTCPICMSQFRGDQLQQYEHHVENCQR